MDVNSLQKTAENLVFVFVAPLYWSLHRTALKKWTEGCHNLKKKRLAQASEVRHDHVCLHHHLFTSHFKSIHFLSNRFRFAITMDKFMNQGSRGTYQAASSASVGW